MINKDDVKQVVDTFSGDTLSLYLRVDNGYIENQAEKPAWQIWLKNKLSEIEQNLTEEQESTWKSIRNRLNEYFDSYEPSSKTLVVMMNGDNERIYELPVTLPNAGGYGDPLLTPMLWAIDEYERYLVVLVDQEEAKLMSAYMGNSTEEDSMQIDLEAYDFGEKTLMPGNTGDGRALREGNNREQYDDMIEAHLDRFYGDVAERIRELFRDKEVTRLILGGSERSAHTVKDKLHESLDECLVGVMAIPVSSSDSEVMEQIGDAAYEFERNYEHKLVEEVINFAKAGGRGALGTDEVKRAFQMQQVELLVLPWDIEDRDLAAELSLKALELNSKIELVHGAAASTLRNEGVDMAARLYYALETETS